LPQIYGINARYCSELVDCNSDPSVAVGHLCVPFKVEMVIRGYMSGHAAREYALGKREICGVPMPEGLKENDKFHRPLLRRPQKRIMGNTMLIFQERTFCQSIVSEEDYLVLENIPETYFKEN
jgi:phosphoribosylaminoimidazole-succinocarboxamide synthase